MKPTAITLTEVCMRDGLQMEPVFVPTEDKVALIDALSHTGLPRIEATSFTSAKAIPALRDAEAVVHQIERRPGTTYSALVLNGRGAERALECAVDELNLVLSVSEIHSLCNTRMTVAQALASLSGICATARGRTRINVSVATAFGCPMEGDIAPRRVLDIAERFASLGVDSITLCDTTGMAHPRQIGDLCREVARSLPGLAVGLHLHNTRGLGLANVLAGLDAGITRFDASLGGLGGCPYAPGASGNVCMEDLVHMLDAMGLDCGVDFERLLACARRLRELVGHELPSQVLHAGPRTRRHAPPEGFGDWRRAALARSAGQA